MCKVKNVLLPENMKSIFSFKRLSFCLRNSATLKYRSTKTTISGSETILLRPKNMDNFTS